MDEAGAGLRGEPCKLIICVLPDDGTCRKLLEDLRTHRDTVQVSSQSVLGMDVFADARAKPGTLPDAYLVRMVQIVVPADEADALFEHVHTVARINRPGGGMILQAPLIAATRYQLPEGVPDE
ncbi:MAG: hypothetical protein AAF637_18120 [Pseudomonadota bacterium]